VKKERVVVSEGRWCQYVENRVDLWLLNRINDDERVLEVQTLNSAMTLIAGSWLV
jgi:hypothetical protein